MLPAVLLLPPRGCPPREGRDRERVWRRCAREFYCVAERADEGACVGDGGEEVRYWEFGIVRRGAEEL